MALISCPDCGREISNSATTCPECAFPVAAPSNRRIARADTASPQPSWWTTSLSILARVLGGTIIAAVGGDEEGSVMAIIGGLTIAASAIPTWYRAKIARLKSEGGVGELTRRLADRMVDFERRQQDHLDRIERMQSEQMADLEERIDFAERLLTKQREQIGPD